MSDTERWNLATFTSSDPVPPGPAPRATVYGPAVLGTVRVDDPRALAALHRARPPAMPRPTPAPAPVPRPVVPPGIPRLAIIGAVLAAVAPPVGCVVSAIALGRIVAARPRPPGEGLAALALTGSILAMAALVAVVAT